MTFDFSDMTDEQVQEALAYMQAEMQRRDTIRLAAVQAAVNAEQFRDAVRDEPPLDKVPDNGVGPGQKIKGKDGKVYVNASQAWLPVGPEAYPAGYRLENAPKASEAQAWKAGLALRAGDLVSHNGVVYKAIVAHTTQADWKPDALASLYVKA